MYVDYITMGSRPHKDGIDEKSGEKAHQHSKEYNA